MNKMNIYSIKDNKVNSFNKPMIEPHLAIVERQVQQVMKNPNSLLGQYPGEFDIYKLGEIDLSSGKIVQSEPVHIKSLTELVEKSDPDQQTMFNKGENDAKVNKN